MKTGTTVEFKIGQLAQISGVSVETLRFYEKEGLLPSPSRTAAGYRLYNNETIKHVNFILKAKGVGFSLNEIKELLSIRIAKEKHTCSDVKKLAEAKLADIEIKLRQLNLMKAALENINEACSGNGSSAINCNILSALEINGDTLC
jgi:MerR family Zn(II)-responsive transcriptional regulator of zntA